MRPSVGGGNVAVVRECAPRAWLVIGGEAEVRAPQFVGGEAEVRAPQLVKRPVKKPFQPVAQNGVNVLDMRDHEGGSVLGMVLDAIPYDSTGFRITQQPPPRESDRTNVVQIVSSYFGMEVRVVVELGR
jgi:hypothetical protein